MLLNSMECAGNTPEFEFVSETRLRTNITPILYSKEAPQQLVSLECWNNSFSGYPLGSTGSDGPRLSILRVFRDQHRLDLVAIRRPQSSRRTSYRSVNI